MFLKCKQLNEAEIPDSDVLVVGAGAVGLTIAVDLARRGRAVTLLEAGDATVSSRSQRYFDTARSTGRPLSGLREGRFLALGGTTNFWGGQLVPFDSIVFERRKWIDPHSEWPISREDLDPFYESALRLLCMPTAIANDEEILNRMKIAVPLLPESLAYFLTRWTPEPNFTTLFRQDIEKLTELRVVTEAPVVALVIGESIGEVAAVEVVDAGHRRLRFRADKVVLANGTVEIARLMSLPDANGDRLPWGASAWLGRGFMDHLDCVAGEVRPLDKRRFHDLFDNLVVAGIKYQPKLKLTELAQRQEELFGVACHFTFNSALSEHFFNAKTFFKALLKGRVEGSIFDVPSQVKTMLLVGMPMILRYLRSRRVYNPADQGIHLRLTSEQRMVFESGLRLRSEMDDLGMPTIDINWRIAGNEFETLAYFAEIVRDYFASAGLADVIVDPRLLARDLSFLEEIEEGNHHMGMARMSDSPSHGVVNRDLRVHGVRNLFVAGAAVYPSTGFPNPTFTAIALGLRLAAHLRGKSRP